MCEGVDGLLCPGNGTITTRWADTRAEIRAKIGLLQNDWEPPLSNMWLSNRTSMFALQESVLTLKQDFGAEICCFFEVHLKFRIVYNDGIKVTWKSLELRFAPPPRRQIKRGTVANAMQKSRISILMCRSRRRHLPKTLSRNIAKIPPS